MVLQHLVRLAAAGDWGLVLAKGIGVIPGPPLGGSDLAQLGLVVGLAYLMHEVGAVIMVAVHWGLRAMGQRARR